MHTAAAGMPVMCEKCRAVHHIGMALVPRALTQSPRITHT